MVFCSYRCVTVQWKTMSKILCIRSASLSHCASVLKMHLPLHFRRIAPLHPLQRHDICDAVDIREPTAALSGISRTSRHAKVSIQWFLSCFPPVISAEVLHKLQLLL